MDETMATKSNQTEKAVYEKNDSKMLTKSTLVGGGVGQAKQVLQPNNGYISDYYRNKQHKQDNHQHLSEADSKSDHQT